MPRPEDLLATPCHSKARGAGLVIAVLASLAVVQPVSSTPRGGAVQPLEPIGHALRLQLLTRTSYEDRSFEEHVSVAMLDAGLPLLNQQWLIAFCDRYADFQGREWGALKDEQKLAIVNEVLMRLKLALTPQAIQQLGDLKDGEAIVTQLEELATQDKQAAYSKVYDRLAKSFPNFENHAQFLESEEFDQLLLLVIQEVLAGRAQTTDGATQATDYDI